MHIFFAGAVILIDKNADLFAETCSPMYARFVRRICVCESHTLHLGTSTVLLYNAYIHQCSKFRGGHGGCHLVTAKIILETGELYSNQQEDTVL